MIPAFQSPCRSIEQRHQRLGRANPVRQERARKGQPRLIAPLAVEVQPLEAVDARRPVAPLQLPFRRIGVSGDAEPAETMHVFEHVPRLAGQAIRRLRNSQGDQVAVVGADLHRVDEQHAVHVARRIGRARRVAVVGEHDEVEPGTTSGSGDLLGRAGAVRSYCVHVNRAAGGQGIWRYSEPLGSRRQQEPDGRDDRDREDEGKPSRARHARGADGIDRRRPGGAPRARACRSAWWTGPSAPA